MMVYLVLCQPTACSVFVLYMDVCLRGVWCVFEECAERCLRRDKYEAVLT